MKVIGGRITAVSDLRSLVPEKIVQHRNSKPAPEDTRVALQAMARNIGAGLDELPAKVLHASEDAYAIKLNDIEK